MTKYCCRECNLVKKGNDGREFRERETVVWSACEESRALVEFVRRPTDDCNSAAMILDASAIDER